MLLSSSQFHIQVRPSPVAPHHSKQNPPSSGALQKTFGAVHSFPAAHLQVSTNTKCRLYSVEAHTQAEAEPNCGFTAAHAKSLGGGSTSKRTDSITQRALEGSEAKSPSWQSGHLPRFTQEADLGKTKQQLQMGT